MSEYTIYHNPRCSKSRQTLGLLQENGIEPEIILYLETPPSVDEIREIIGKLGIQARDLVRKTEQEYKELNLKDSSLTDEKLVEAMAQHPKLIERPIVIKADSAVLGRPPENVMSLI